MLRIAEPEDFDLVRSMAMEFLAMSGYESLASLDSIDVFIKNLLSSDKTQTIILLHEDQGMLVATTSPFLFNPSLKVAHEIAWWVSPEARKNGVGKELLEAFEYWAKEKCGADICIMASINDKLDEFYIREGYKLYERAYSKIL